MEGTKYDLAITISPEGHERLDALAKVLDGIGEELKNARESLDRLTERIAAATTATLGDPGSLFSSVAPETDTTP
jgi:hypothetical protein